MPTVAAATETAAPLIYTVKCPKNKLSGGFNKDRAKQGTGKLITLNSAARERERERERGERKRGIQKRYNTVVSIKTDTVAHTYVRSLYTHTSNFI